MNFTHRHTLGLAASIVASATLMACGGGGGGDGGGSGAEPPAPPPTATLSCEQLQGLIVPASAIGLPTSGATVTATKTVAASGSGATALPEYCEVTAKISPVDSSAPDIRFQVALPASWNQKVVMLGGG